MNTWVSICCNILLMEKIYRSFSIEINDEQSKAEQSRAEQLEVVKKHLCKLMDEMMVS